MAIPPLLSIIIPTYNSGKTLRVALDSIYSQTFKNLEIRIIDNESSDDTAEIVSYFSLHHTNIYWFSEHDEGLYDAMNKGIDLCEGEWLYFMGSDDYFLNNVVLERIFAHGDIFHYDVIYGNVEWGNSHKIYDGYFSVLKLMQKNISHQAIFFNKIVFEKHGKFELKYSSLADYAFNIKWFNDLSVKRKYVETLVVKYGTGGFSAQNKDFVFEAEKDAIIEKYFPEEYSSLHKQLQFIYQELTKKDQEIALLNNHINENQSFLNNLLINHNNEILNFSQITTRDVLQKVYEETTARSEEMVSLFQQIQNKEQDLVALHQLLYQNQIIRHEEQLEKNKEITVLNQELVAKNREIDQLNQKYQNEVEALKKFIEAIKEELRFNESCIILKENAIISKDNEISTLHQALNDKNRVIQNQEKSIQDIHRSLSWRITKPVRAFLDWMLFRRKSNRINPCSTNEVESEENNLLRPPYQSNKDVSEIPHNQSAEYYELEKYVRHLEYEIRFFKDRLDIILNSKTWRIANATRKLLFPPLQIVYPFFKSYVAKPENPIEIPANNQNSDIQLANNPQVLFVSGESNTPGHLYRVKRYLETYQYLGIPSKWLNPEELALDLNLLNGVSLLIIWRAGYGDYIKAIMEYARNNRITIIYDLDDYMFDPALAEPEIIDGIRHRNLDKNEVKEFFYKIRLSMNGADFFTSPTFSLSSEMSNTGKKAFVLPNGYDFSTFKLSVYPNQKPNDHLIRIGYAGGTQTHQKDFAVALPGLVKILKEFPNTRITLFGETMELSEFPELNIYHNQIEIRSMVPVEQLQLEIARFDINIAPLEINPFCNAKSELKYFEAALLKIPTIATPTVPYTQIILNGVNGFLANNDNDWYQYLKELVTNIAFRKKIGINAYYHVLWRFSPEERIQFVFDFLMQIDKVNSINIAHKELRKLASEFRDQIAPYVKSQGLQIPSVVGYNVILEYKSYKFSKAGVIIPLYNYENFIEAALESVKNQTYKDIDLVIIDDCSTDQSLSVVKDWLEKNHNRFNNSALLQNKVNSKLGATRNSGFDYIQTPWVLPLDADNELLPLCVEKSLSSIENSGAALAYSHLILFGEEELYIKQVYGNSIIGNRPWEPKELARGNYIDAMAFISKACWASVGGYESNFKIVGWEDYDLWLRFVERGFFGINIPEKLARYRVHKNSMLRTQTDMNQTELRKEIIERHPWIKEFIIAFDQ